MPVEVILPKVDMDMATGRISRWAVEEGAKVRKGDLLFEIETDKAAMEIDAPASGVIRDISGREGVDIPVGEAVAWIYEEGEGELSPLPCEEQGGRDSPSPAASRPPLPPEGGEDRRPGLRPGYPHPHEVGERWIGQAPKVAARDGEGGFQTTGERFHTGGDTRGLRATPLARRIAKDAGIDLAAVAGSGPRGRVTRADVEAFIEIPPSDLPAISPSRGEIGSLGGGSSLPTPTIGESKFEGVISRLEGEVPSDNAVLKLFEEGSYELVPHDGMRKTIARRLVEAKSTIPHFYLTLDCEIDALLALRKQLNDAAPMVKTEAGDKPAYKLSVNDMVIKAMALALKAVPDANVSWTEGAMVKHRHADVGVAVSIPGGLITPIVRKADEKTLSAISNEMKDLAARARNRKLKPEEYQGGTTAVSNLGMFGIKDFAAVINPPHATILAVGAGEERAVVKGGEIRAATIMSVTLSTDHRAVDGALGAELLAAFKRLVENPMAMLV
jgi:pyruvate dehydrogenase E2 component (dihydrolipoamide acetyltransferase)